MARMPRISGPKAGTMKDAALKSIFTDAGLVGDATPSHDFLSMSFHSHVPGMPARDRPC